MKYTNRKEVTERLLFFVAAISTPLRGPSLLCNDSVYIISLRNRGKNLINFLRFQKFWIYYIYKVYFYNVSMKMLKRIHKILKTIKKFRRNNKSNLNIFLIFAAIVMIWSGIANLLDLYFFPNNPLVGNLICIVLWLFILLLDDWKLRELEWELEKKEEIKKLK